MKNLIITLTILIGLQVTAQASMSDIAEIVKDGKSKTVKSSTVEKPVVISLVFN
jgi:hypothetical protein